ncbi:hypothetical protein TARUN_1871 [Trichoderma arundinaceum]|uniref:Uncharacterized protein n=1 Tax=Trichoderma arundinaceum TaxID=490622 RepID=A0A395NWF0_TRIAR|nr:hypothetical protein TARUN_1871 [Trichoderma arundinaceum]
MGGGCAAEVVTGAGQVLEPPRALLLQVQHGARYTYCLRHGALPGASTGKAPLAPYLYPAAHVCRVPNPCTVQTPLVPVRFEGRVPIARPPTQNRAKLGTQRRSTVGASSLRCSGNQGLASWEAPWPSAASHWIAADPPPLRLTCAVRAKPSRLWANPWAVHPPTAAKAGRVFYLDASTGQKTQLLFESFTFAVQ